MLTRKDIKEFKEGVRKDNDAIIKVGSGETVTVRVPTHEDGRLIFWEFSTDFYDLGFGLYFEWTLSPSNNVTVHVSDSSDEDEEAEGRILFSRISFNGRKIKVIFCFKEQKAMKMRINMILSLVIRLSTKISLHATKLFQYFDAIAMRRSMPVAICILVAEFICLSSTTHILCGVRKPFTIAFIIVNKPS